MVVAMHEMWQETAVTVPNLVQGYALMKGLPEPGPANPATAASDNPIKDTVNKFMLGTANPLSKEWIFTVPGVVVKTAVFSRSDALRFIHEQLKQPQSSYRMPVFTAAQRSWEAWFKKVLDIGSMCPDLPAAWVIPTLTGSLQADDRRIYGWHDHVVCQQSDGREPTLTEFIAHVRRQVLATNTTRRAAANELAGLVQNHSELDDCLALSTKLKQLFMQLYPRETNGSSEPEPVTRLAAVRTVHQLLQQLHTRGNNKLSLVRAWKAYTSYDGAQMFDKYVDEAVHLAGSSVEIATSYLRSVCEQLERAHRMYVQTVRVEDTPVHPTGGGDRRMSVNAMAKALNVAPTALAAWVGGNAGTRRGAQGSSPAKPGKKGKRSRTDEGAAGPSKAQRTPDKQHGNPLNDKQRAVFKDMAAATPSRPVGWLARKTGHDISPEAALAAINAGACLLCCKSDKHVARECPLRASHKEDCHAYFNDYRARLQAKNNK